MPEECQLLPPDKQREPDDRIRLIHIEALLLIASTLTGRFELRKRNVYRVVQLLHKAEQEVEVKEAIERLVNFLQRDEGDETRVEEVPAAAMVDEDELVQEV